MINKGMDNEDKTLHKLIKIAEKEFKKLNLVKNPQSHLIKMQNILQKL